MDVEKLTTRAAEAVGAAFTRATVDHAPTIEAAHLLVAVLAMDDATVQALLHETGAPADLKVRAERLVAGQPKVTGATTADPQPSRGFLATLAAAEAQAGELGDSYVAVPHLLLGLAADRDTGGLLPDVGPCARRTNSCVGTNESPPAPPRRWGMR
jgi:ATP-dependent Clp protease ATP-binding subunit ClpB